MLQDFVTAHRTAILDQARTLAIEKDGVSPTQLEVAVGLPLFLDQLCDALRLASMRQPSDRSELRDAASQYGDRLFDRGLSVAQVVNGYGNMCQAITGIAVRESAPIEVGEYQMLNLCLDEATCGAVTAFSLRRENAITGEGTERLGMLAHEMRNVLNAIILSFATIKNGSVGASGKTAGILDRNLIRLQSLIDRSLADVRLEAGMQNLEHVAVNEVFEEVEIGALAVAETRGVRFVVTRADPSAVVEVDRQILAATIANLTQNALKFTKAESTVKLGARVAAGRIFIDVEDECGGLPDGATESLLRPFVQKGRNRTGLGLGLAICLKATKAMNGELAIRDVPGKGCVFTINLPMRSPKTS